MRGSLYDRYRELPALRSDCDANLQIAFGEGNWTRAITCAKQQFKRTKDPYFEVVELAVRSQLDTPADLFAAWVSLESILNEGKTIKDSFTLELYEWSTSSMNKDYSKTLGKLRADFVKEAWKPDADKAAVAIRSYKSCVANEDWENAQVIAATVDKKFPNESRYMFLNILAHYILSNRLPADNPKREMSRRLSEMMIDKAKELRDKAPFDKFFPPRALSTEGDILLWFRIKTSHKTPEEIRALLKKPEFNPLKYLCEGHVSVFKAIMDLLSTHQEYRRIYEISQEVFYKGMAYIFKKENVAMSEVIKEDDEIWTRMNAMKMETILDFTQNKPADPAAQVMKDIESTGFRTAVMDWTVWNSFIRAAREIGDDGSALRQLEGFVRTVLKFTKLPSICNKMVLICALEGVFDSLDSHTWTGVSDPLPMSALVGYVRNHCSKVSCFDDIKPFVEKFGHADKMRFAANLSKLALEELPGDIFKSFAIGSISARISYLMVASSKSVGEKEARAHPICLACGAEIKKISSCIPCLQHLAQLCAVNYNWSLQRSDLRERIQSEDVDPIANVAIVGATSLLKIAGLDCSHRDIGFSDHTSLDLRLILQATLWLQDYHRQSASKSSEMTLFLTKLYLLVGCVPQARSLWDTLGVKNVTLESIGPLFSDRLSSIAPGMWRADGATPMSQYHRYFKDAVNRHIPTQITTALECGNYASVLGLMEARDKLRNSCTMVMANVEDRRGLRAIGSRYLADVHFDQVLIQMQEAPLNLNLDCAALPNLEEAPAHLAEAISIGPLLSPQRASISLHVEDFLCVISSKNPKDYKPSKPAFTADNYRHVVLEVATRLQDDWGQQLKNVLGGSCPMTSAEGSYFSIIHDLADLIVLCTSQKTWEKNSKRPSRLTGLVTDISMEILNQRGILQEAPEKVPEELAILSQVICLHPLGMLRESLQAVKMTLSYLEQTVAASKEAPKWILEECKPLKTSIAGATTFVKYQIETLTDVANAPGLIENITGYMFGDVATGEKPVQEVPDGSENVDWGSTIFRACGLQEGIKLTLDRMQKDWQSMAQGWSTVKLD